MKDREAVMLKARDVIEGVRGYVASQKALWQSIPWLALHACKHIGSDGYWSNFYTEGVLLVHAPGHNNGQSNAYVDLAAGTLIDTREFHLRGRIVEISAVELLQFSLALDVLDASAYVHRMRKAIDTPFMTHLTPERLEQDRLEAVERYKLTPVYQGLVRRGI